MTSLRCVVPPGPLSWVLSPSLWLAVCASHTALCLPWVGTTHCQGPSVLPEAIRVHWQPLTPTDGTPSELPCLLLYLHMSGVDRFWGTQISSFWCLKISSFYPDTLYFILNTLAQSSLAPGNILSLASPETCGFLKSLSYLMETFVGEIFQFSLSELKENASADIII